MPFKELGVLSRRNEKGLTWHAAKLDLWEEGRVGPV